MLASNSAVGSLGDFYASLFTEYRLVAFISHMGTSTMCGHYVCHIMKEGRLVDVGVVIECLVIQLVD